MWLLYPCFARQKMRKEIQKDNISNKKKRNAIYVIFDYVKFNIKCFHGVRGTCTSGWDGVRSGHLRE